MFTYYENFIEKTLTNFGIGSDFISFFSILTTVVIITILCFFADFVAKRIMLSLVAQFAKKSKTVLDDILVEKKFFHRLAQMAPAIVIYSLAPVAFYKYPITIHWIQIIANTFMILVGARTIDSFLDSLHAMYELLPDAKQKPIKGYIQVFKIIIYFIAILMILSVLFDKSLVYFFSGLGALAAVLMLVFKDSILGLVAGIQLSSNNMLKPGDWITFSKYNADGNVIEISLQTVKVQNFDKTIVTIPTYSLIAESFQNWRGMEESEGRRFKRNITIDSRSVKTATSELIAKLNNIPEIKSFIDADKSIEESISKRSLIKITILGLFRMYVEYIIKNAEQVNQSMSSIVKLGSLNENGLTVELFCFTKEKGGVVHEKFQAILIEHLLAHINYFDLDIYQHPSGKDVQSSSNA